MGGLARVVYNFIDTRWGEQAAQRKIEELTHQKLELRKERERLLTDLEKGIDPFMSDALEEARQGAAEGGVPIGAALVDTEGNLVATGRNRRIQDRSMVMHAEINCLHNAGRTMNSIQGMTMYSTLIPCNMCAGAIVQFGITKVIAAESENFAENNGLDLLLRHGVEIIDLDLAEAKELLRRFIERNPREWHGDIGQDPGKA